MGEYRGAVHSPSTTDGSNQRGMFIIQQTSRGSTMEQEDVKDVDIWKEKMQQDINDIRQRQGHNEEKLGSLESEVHKLQVSDQLQNKDISLIKDTLSKIEGNTEYIRGKMDEEKENRLKEYRKFWLGIISAIIIAALLIGFGLN